MAAIVGPAPTTQMRPTAGPARATEYAHHSRIRRLTKKAQARHCVAIARRDFKEFTHTVEDHRHLICFTCEHSFSYNLRSSQTPKLRTAPSSPATVSDRSSKNAEDSSPPPPPPIRRRFGVCIEDAHTRTHTGCGERQVNLRCSQRGARTRYAAAPLQEIRTALG